MDDTTRIVIGACYAAVCGAAGIHVREEADDIIRGALDSNYIRDSEAAAALRAMVREPRVAVGPGTLSELSDAMVNVTESVSAVSAAVNDESIARLTAYVARRVGRIDATTSREEIGAILGMVDALEGALKRAAVAAAADKVDA
jgi:hypothetical protein